MNVGLIGLGLMGFNLALRLLDNNFKLFVWNRSIDKCHSLRKVREDLVQVCLSPKEVVSRSDVVILFLADDDAVLDVALSRDGLIESDLNGKYIVNMSTITITTSKKLAKLVEDRGGVYVECPVLGSIDAAREGKLILFISCKSRDVIDKLSTLFNVISTKIYYVGDVPKAMALKLAINQLNMTIVASLAESLTFLKRANVDLELFREVLLNTWMKVIVDRFWDRMVCKTSQVRFKVKLAGKDLLCFVNSGKELNLDTPLAAIAAQKYFEIASQGFGDEDYPQIAYHKMKMLEK